ncbi:MAG: 16S rRNA (uracil(1498)-N(3))-methyltransferase [Elusimicrobiota bacterium]
MQRFFVENINGDIVEITGSEAHHIKNVLRKKKGDAVFLFDGKGNEYETKISEITDNIKLKIISKTQKDFEPKIKINLYQSIPKFKKFDFIVEKSTELGVSKIIPVISQRTQITFTPLDRNLSNGAGIKDTDYTDRKIKRWQKIAISAAKQCGRNIIPEISPVANFHDVVMSLRATTATTGSPRGRSPVGVNPDKAGPCSVSEVISIIPWECEQKTTLKKILSILNSQFSILNLFIGPEGGFSNAEIELAKKCGVIPVTLGKRILRTETAPIVVISNILYELEG